MKGVPACLNKASVSEVLGQVSLNARVSCVESILTHCCNRLTNEGENVHSRPLSRTKQFNSPVILCIQHLEAQRWNLLLGCQEDKWGPTTTPLGRRHLNVLEFDLIRHCQLNDQKSDKNYALLSGCKFRNNNKQTIPPTDVLHQSFQFLHFSTFHHTDFIKIFS